ncbi:MAG TPA: hypothetical protein PKD09_18590 [Aggregatilinea sp.]|uniref:hypothetical protein n=1 Tax=Aggregatilinea sp. TaxID=2806333 RepID=UPI002BA55442|nr:hypothetical protein [Aggregatilinea sp.]HML23671.1 hypothetical protein [Aggregatilinea sp.]
MSRSAALRAVPLLACVALALLFTLDSPSAHGSPDPQATAPALDANDVIFADQLVEELPPRSLTAALSRPASRCTENGVALYDQQTGDTRVIDPADCTQAPLHGPHCGSCGNEDMWSPDGRYLAYTVRAESELATRETRFYDAVKDEIVPLEEVSAHTTSWLPYWSPQWRYYIEGTTYLPDYQEDCRYTLGDSDLHSAIVIKHLFPPAGSVPICTNWENIEAEKWLADDRVLVRAFVSDESWSVWEDRFVVALQFVDVLDLGADVPAENVFWDTADLLVRLRILSAPYPPEYCAVSITDLNTLISRDIEATICLQPADITVYEPSQQLAYLYSAPQLGKETYTLTPEVHIADLNKYAIRTLPIEGVNEIGSFSPDGRYLLLVLDDLHSKNRDLFTHNPWSDPRLVIFDLIENKMAFEFSIDPWDKSSSDFFKPFTDLSTSVFWSPSSSALIVVGEHQTFVLDVAAQTQVPVTKIQATDTFRVTVEWYGEDGRLLVEAIPTDPAATATLGRWVIDPGLS